MKELLLFLFSWLFPQEAKANLSSEDWSGNDYIRDKPESSRRTVIKTEFAVHDIQKIFDRLNQQHFQGRIKAKITWGKHGCKNVPRKRSILFGTYSSAELLIRIHPAIDIEKVPEFFVEHVIHHEMLHEVCPPIKGSGGKWIIHHYDFRVAEAATPSYKKAMHWEKENWKKVFIGPAVE
ncbi:MAG: hypothetical protein NT150_07470 [Bacteroidetes bacterium]|nr:hypothetical protein [Bacteroidota bacterium]